MKGLFCSCLKKNLLLVFISSSMTPTDTFMPVWVSFLIPLPATIGFGSIQPITTFLIPDLIIASVQGPVLPV